MDQVGKISFPSRVDSDDVLRNPWQTGIASKLEMKESTMRLSLFFLCVSSGQSFVTRRLVAVSHPFSEAIRKTTKPVGWGASSLAFSFLGQAERERSSVKRISMRMAETLTTAGENATTTGDLSNGKTEILADDPQFVKPDPDNHEYRCIKLSNNLKVLLVSTSHTSSDDEKSAKVEAASVHVQAGHFDDTIPGKLCWTLYGDVLSTGFCSSNTGIQLNRLGPFS